MKKSQCWRCGRMFETAIRMTQVSCMDCLRKESAVGGLYQEPSFDTTTRKLSPLVSEWS